MLVLSACGQPTPEQQPAAEQPSATEGVPVGLERFYTQELTFGSCAGYATTDADAAVFANDTFECARFEVPLDYENPYGRTAQIALLRIPAQGKPIGSLLLIEDGARWIRAFFLETLASIARKTMFLDWHYPREKCLEMTKPDLPRAGGEAAPAPAAVPATLEWVGCSSNRRTASVSTAGLLHRLSGGASALGAELPSAA